MQRGGLARRAQPRDPLARVVRIERSAAAISSGLPVAAPSGLATSSGAPRRENSTYASFARLNAGSARFWTALTSRM